jgi:hypothetical protein
MARAAFFAFWAVFIMAGESQAADPPPVVFEVEAGRYARRDTPVLVPLPESLNDAAGFTVEDLANHKFIPVQKVSHVNGFSGIAWIIREPLAAGTTRRYRLSSSQLQAVSRPVGGVRALLDHKPVEDNSGSLAGHKTATLAVGDRPVLTYQAAVAEPPAGIDAIYRRSGFIHPLQTPSGISVTDDFPPDHAHQHGLFFAWVNTNYENRKIDFWNVAGKTGRVSHAKPGGAQGDSIKGGPVFGELIVQLVHDDLTAPGGRKPVLRETWHLLVYDIAEQFVVDFMSMQNVVDKTLTINKYHYGGLGFRGNRQWFDASAGGNEPPDPVKSGQSDFLTSEGKRRKGGNHTRPRWVDLSGQVDGRWAGVAILDDPTNFRFPQPVRLHPNKPYFCFAPMVDGEFTISAGHPYVSRYRLVIHDGPSDSRLIDQVWHDYADPPHVRFIEDKL